MRRALPLVALPLLLAAPARAVTPRRLVTVRVLDAGGRVVVEESTTLAMPAGWRFAVASGGWNDPGSAEGRVAVDDLRVTRADGSVAATSFDAPPAVQPADGTVARYDAGGHRLLAVADSGRSCATASVTVALGSAAPVTSASFTVSRLPRGDVEGDGSYWDVYAGVVPAGLRPLRGASCEAATPTGTVAGLAGVVVQGDGDDARSAVGAVAGDPLSPAVPVAVGATLRVVVTLTDLTVRPAIHVAPRPPARPAVATRHAAVRHPAAPPAAHRAPPAHAPAAPAPPPPPPAQPVPAPHAASAPNAGLATAPRRDAPAYAVALAAAVLTGAAVAVARREEPVRA